MSCQRAQRAGAICLGHFNSSICKFLVSKCLDARLSSSVNTYAAEIRSRSSGLPGQTPGPKQTVPLTFTATGTSLPSAFCARAELKAIFTMAERNREFLDRTTERSLATVGRLSLLRLVTQFASSSLTRASGHWRGLRL